LEGVCPQAGKLALAFFTPILLQPEGQKILGSPDQAANTFLQDIGRVGGKVQAQARADQPTGSKRFQARTIHTPPQQPEGERSW
jgi:hypothetical protein